MVAWREHVLADGMILVADDGHDAAIRVRTWVRPQCPARAIAARVARDLGARHGDPAITGRRVITSEGEFAGLLLLAAPDGAAAAVGVIYGEDFHREIVGVSHAAALVEPVRSAVAVMTEHAELGLGSRRHRRFDYRPPVGWQALCRDLTTEWYAPDFPRDTAVLTVPPTRPLAVFRTADILRERLRPVSPFGPCGPPIQRTPETVGDLRGEAVDYAGPDPETGATRRARRLLLTDEIWVYEVRLDGDDVAFARAEATLRALAETIAPLPRVPPGSPGTTPMDYWT